MAGIEHLASYQLRFASSTGLQTSIAFRQYPGKPASA
jgi:hypothetical protein